MNDLLSALAARPLLCDGAMGTQLLANGLHAGECGVLWNAEYPNIVSAVHEAYRRAGCHTVTTNTLEGSSFALERHGLAGRMAELNRAGAQIAREIAGDSGWVFGDIGPIGAFLGSPKNITVEQLHALFRAQALALIEGGVDALLLETMSDPAEVEIAVAAVQDCSALPILATYAFQKTGDAAFRTLTGTSVEEAMQRAIAAGAHSVGANCGVALSFPDYLELARQLVRAAGKTPVILQPNAGTPQMVGNQAVYCATPEAMATLVEPFLATGVRIIGGCCGTTPAHLATMSGALAR
ncbi:MAG: homocysteine S-methyltransferase family protein [Verrucomicrobiota bacterium]